MRAYEKREYVTNYKLISRLFVVSTKIGGVPEVLPSHMIHYASPEEDGNRPFFYNKKRKQTGYGFLFTDEIYVCL